MIFRARLESGGVALLAFEVDPLERELTFTVAREGKMVIRMRMGLKEATGMLASLALNIDELKSWARSPTSIQDAGVKHDVRALHAHREAGRLGRHHGNDDDDD
jgi:hypothetical protein